MARISWRCCSAVGCAAAIWSERSLAPESSAEARRLDGTGATPASGREGSRVGEGTGSESVPPSEVRIVEVVVATATGRATRAAGATGVGAVAWTTGGGGTVG